MPIRTKRTRILDAGKVSLGCSHIDPKTLKFGIVDGDVVAGPGPLPDWLELDPKGGTVRRTDGVEGDRQVYEFQFVYDETPAQQKHDNRARAAGAQAKAKEAPAWIRQPLDQVLAYHKAQVEDVIDSLPELPAGQQKVVDVIQALAAENRALIQMVYALKLQAWPDLEEREETVKTDM